MDSPTRDRTNTFRYIPPARLPSNLVLETEGTKEVGAASRNSDLSAAMETTRTRHSSVVVKTTRKSKEKISLPPARPSSPPPAPKPYSIPPPPPPLSEKEEEENMTYGYGHHFQHPLRNDIEKKTRARRASSTAAPPPPPPPTTRSQRNATPRVIEIPPPPPGYQGPFLPAYFQQDAVMHICRICLRPRSEKYHLEHPIIGVPPPPGICRRCRVKKVSEAYDRHVEVVREGESEPIRIGVACLVPGEDVLTRDEVLEEMAGGKAKRYGRIEEGSDDHEERKSSSEESVETRRVVYRHVRVKDGARGVPPPPPPQTEVSVENLAAMNLMNDRISPRASTRESRRASVRFEDLVQPALHRLHSVRAAELEKIDSPMASVSAHTSKWTRVKGQDIAEAAGSVRNGRTSVAAVAGTTTTGQRPGYSESEIRHFARDEVERYRQAERMIEAHPNACAHGRMVPVVPVERRIEVERDQVRDKPWEVPPPPPFEPVPQLARSPSPSGRGYYTSKRSVKVPSEDPRLWYHEQERPSSERRSGSDQHARTASRRDVTREEDIEVIIRRERTPSPRRMEPESDAPRSVKLREVVGAVREEPAGSTRSRSTRSEPAPRQNIIEVIEEIELPLSPEKRVRDASERPTSVRTVRGTEAPVSGRVKELQEEAVRYERAQKSLDAPMVVGSGVSSLQTDTEYWRDGDVVRRASQRSSTFPKDARTPERTRAVHQEELRVPMPSPGKFLKDATYENVPESDRTWHESRASKINIQPPHPQNVGRRPARPQDDDDKTVWPRDDEPIRPAASERTSTVKDDWDWEYTERIVQPADRPRGSRPFDEEPARYYTEHEHLTRRRPSKSRLSEARHLTSGTSPPQIKITPATQSTLSSLPGHSPPERGRGPYMRMSDESAHVRFASKVEFSPTPPGSDEHLPLRLRERDYAERQDARRDQRKSGLSREVFGDVRKDRESGAELIEEYERRRAQRPEDEFDYVYERGSRGRDDFDDRRYEMHGGLISGHLQTSFQESHRRDRERAGFTRGPLRDHDGEDYERRHHPHHSHHTHHPHRSHHGNHQGERCHSMQDPEEPTQLNHSKPLARALSESPSRENLRTGEGESRGRSTGAPTSSRTSRRPGSRSLETSPSLGRNLERTSGRGLRRRFDDEVEVDGKGPYR